MTSKNTYPHTCTHAHMHTCTHAHMHTYVYIYTPICRLTLRLTLIMHTKQESQKSTHAGALFVRKLNALSLFVNTPPTRKSERNFACADISDFLQVLVCGYPLCAAIPYHLIDPLEEFLNSDSPQLVDAFGDELQKAARLVYDLLEVATGNWRHRPKPGVVDLLELVVVWGRAPFQSPETKREPGTFGYPEGHHEDGVNQAPTCPGFERSEGTVRLHNKPCFLPHQNNCTNDAIRKPIPTSICPHHVRMQKQRG